MSDKEQEVNMSTDDGEKFLEIETKYEANSINRLDFKALAKSLNPVSFLYVESRDIYYVNGDSEFLRYRMPSESSDSNRSELTLKKKHVSRNNNVRTEVNLRIDGNSHLLVETFCNNLGYKRDFSVYKLCDIYFFEDGDIVFYSVIDDLGKTASFIEIEVNEEKGYSEEQSWEIIQKYEKILSPLGISAQKRKKLSLFEMYRTKS